MSLFSTILDNFKGASANDPSIMPMYGGSSSEPTSTPSYNGEEVPLTEKSVETLLNAYGDTNSQTVNGYHDLYTHNSEWAEEQAQKQMDFQTSANKIAMDFASAEADKARAWEAEMANTAYQRAVKDLKAAGLNPILAYSQGGAAVPSVSAAQGVTSSGAQAVMADTGYGSYKLDFAKTKLAVSSAFDIAKLILSLVPTASTTSKIGF